MANGCAGRILHVDLTAHALRVETPPEDFYRRYMGGSLMGLNYILKEMPARADCLGPPGVVRSQQARGTLPQLNYCEGQFYYAESLTGETLPEKLSRRLQGTGPTSGVVIVQAQIEVAKDTCRRLRGWDTATGNPTAERLRQMGLEWAAP